MKNYAVWIVTGLYIVLSLWIHPHFWQQLYRDDASTNAVYGEVVAAEWGMEQLYQNVLAGKNPFGYQDGQLYPFGNSLLSTDSGNGFFFVFLRPWLSINQSLSVVIIASVVMACLGMYLLLTTMGVTRGVAFWLGASFGFTTILQPRMGHLTYMSIYVFPWFFYAVSKTKPILAAIVLVLTLYLNLYYFVTLGILIGIVGGYYLWNNRKRLREILGIYQLKLMMFVGATIVFISPWLIMFVRVLKFEGLPVTEGWGGAVDYSADLLGILIPSAYSKNLWVINDWIGKRLLFATSIFEGHIYPGIIILLGLPIILLSWRKLIGSQKKLIAPWAWGAILFWILTLGPFLHLAGKWRINLEQIAVVIPLPFVLLHYLPFVENVRSPGRLAVGMVFLAYVAIGLWIRQSKTLNRSGYYGLILVMLGMLFAVDSPLMYAPAQARVLPNQIYQTLANESDGGSVYEMPSAVRDGFKYFGNLESLDFVTGQLIHQKPMIAGYFGRVPDYKREYLANNPFFGYMGRLMDPGVEHNGAIDRTELPKWQRMDPEMSKKAIDLVGLKYVVLQSDASYSASASAALTGLGFTNRQTDYNFDLWVREAKVRDILEVKVGQPGDEIFMGQGWRGRDKSFRWGGKTTSIMLRTAKSGEYELIVNGASYYKPQTAEVYLNQHYVGKLSFETDEKELRLKLTEVKEGLLTLHFIFPRAYQPLVVEPGNADESYLAVRLSSVKLEAK